MHTSAIFSAGAESHRESVLSWNRNPEASCLCRLFNKENPRTIPCLLDFMNMPAADGLVMHGHTEVKGSRGIFIVNVINGRHAASTACGSLFYETALPTCGIDKVFHGTHASLDGRWHAIVLVRLVQESDPTVKKGVGRV
jgi:hypothetical protein